MKNDTLSINKAISIDGINITVQGYQYYDVTLHYVQYEQPTIVCDMTRVRILNNKISLYEGPSMSWAANLQTVIDDSLRTHFVVSISDPENSFTIVTDGAAVMAKMTEKSVSRTRSSPDHNWMHCLV